MTTGDVFPGSRPEGAQWLQPVATAGRPRLPYQATRRRVVFGRRAALPVSDAFSLFLAALLAMSDWSAIGYGAAVLIFLRLSGRQRLRICLRLSDELVYLAAAASLPVPLFLFFMPQDALLRLAVLSGGLLIVVRFTLYVMLRAAYRRKWLAERVLIVGSGKLGVEIWELLQRHPELGMRPIGFICCSTPQQACPLPLLGGMSELPDLVLAYDIRRVIITLPGDSDAALVSVLRAGQRLPAEVCVVPRMYELAPAIPGSYQDDIWGIPLVALRGSGPGRSARLLKRAFDIVAGTALLLIFGPLLAVLMGGVLLSCGRPVLFRQARVTRSGRIMKITKIRTVASTSMDRRWTVAPEECPALGRWLRATHLDELPQLLNVVRGDMSLVGPRPERPYFTARFAKDVPRYDDRHRTNGGMTGWAQVHGLTGDTSIQERARFDNYYIEHWSLWLDLVILVRTLTRPMRDVLSTRRSADDAKRR